MPLHAHPTAHISQMADIEDSPRGTIVSVGEKSMIDSFVKIKPTGGSGNVTIGSKTMVNSGCVFYSGNGITIGDNVLIAANCTFAPVNHAFKDKSRPINEQRFLPSKGGIIIEDDVWIGAGCVILDGAILRKGCVIGAMSLVRGEIEAYSINIGNPLAITGYRE